MGVDGDVVGVEWRCGVFSVGERKRWRCERVVDWQAWWFRTCAPRRVTGLKFPRRVSQGCVQTHLLRFTNFDRTSGGHQTVVGHVH